MPLLCSHYATDFKSFEIDGDINLKDILGIYKHLFVDGVVRTLEDVVPVV